MTARTAALSPETTLELIRLARGGDRDARERLLTRCLQSLTRWAHGMLPARARGMEETADLVQEAVIKFFDRMDSFVPQHEGALHGYLHKIVRTGVIDRLRKPASKNTYQGLPDQMPSHEPSPLEKAIGAQHVERYERARDALDEQDRLAIVLRVDLQYSFDEIRVMLDKPSVDAARMAVTRAIGRLKEEMTRAGHVPR